MQITSVPTPTVNQPQQKKKLTVLYFVDGKNNLSPMAKHSFDSLAQVGSDENVNVVAELGLLKQDVLRGLVEKGGFKNPENLGKANMGSPKGVQDFVEWGMKNYPAEKYMVCLWNHGAGFLGVLTDEEANSMCNNKDLAKALEDAQKNAGQKIDVLNFNACLMSQTEVSYEYRNSAKYIVGSQEVEAGLRLPLPGVFGTTPQHTVLKDVMAVLKDARNVYQTRGDLSAEQLAKLFVYESKHQPLTTMFTPSQAAIDTSKMEGVRNSCEALAGAFLAAADQDPTLIDRLRKDIHKVQHYCNIDAHVEPYVDYRDLGDFTKVLLKDDQIPQNMKDAARALQGAISSAVVAEQHATVSAMVGKSMEGSTGLSAYLPTDYGFDRAGHSAVDGIPVGGTHGYEKTSFGEGSNWEKMLKKISKDDDYAGRFPKINRQLMNVGQISRMYGYEQLWSAAKGAAVAGGWSIWPLAGFPYMLPIPGRAAAGIGVVGGLLRTNAGVGKMIEAARRDDSPNRAKLALDGILDTAIGAGTTVGCGAMMLGVMTPGIRLAAEGALALAAARLAVKGGVALYNHHQETKKSVADKLAEADHMQPNLPAAPAAEEHKAA